MKLQRDARTFEMEHLLTYYECTDAGQPSLSMILSMMTLVSDAHSAALGMDTATIQQTGGAWVITEYDGELATRQPHYGEKVILGTKAVAYNRFFALREFYLLDEDKQYRYAHFQAMFVFMNLQKRRLMSLPPKLITPFKSPMEKRLPRLAKPTEVEGKPTDERDYQVRYFDIDVNHHVNNARYFDWLLDPLGSEFLRTHRVKRVVIKYQHEVQEGTIVTSRYQLNELDGQVMTAHQILVNGQVCASAELTWQKMV